MESKSNSQSLNENEDSLDLLDTESLWKAKLEALTSNIGQDRTQSSTCSLDLNSLGTSEDFSDLPDFVHNQVKSDSPDQDSNLQDLTVIDKISSDDRKSDIQRKKEPVLGARYQIDESLSDFESESDPEVESPPRNNAKGEKKILETDSDATCSIDSYSGSLLQQCHDRPKAVPVRRFTRPKTDNETIIIDSSPETTPQKPTVRKDNGKNIQSKITGIKRSSTGNNEEITDVSPGKITCLSDNYGTLSVTESVKITTIPRRKVDYSSEENGASKFCQEVPNQSNFEAGNSSNDTRRFQKDKDLDQELENEVTFVMGMFHGIDRDWVKHEIRRLKMLQTPDYIDQVINVIIGEEQTSPVAKDSTSRASSSPDVVVALGNTRLESDINSVVSGGSSAEHTTVLEKKSSTPGKKGKGKALIKQKPIMKYTDEVDALYLEEDGCDMICDDRVSSSSLTCEACKMNRSQDKVVQCCECHIICNTCVEREVKVILSPDSQETAVKCPCDHCNSSIPESQAKKILPNLIIELLEEKMNKQVMDSISKMDDLVTCPSCSFPVIIDDGIKQFKCPCCQKKSCRYCKRLWEIANHDDCNHFTSSNQNPDSKDLEPPSYWHPMPEEGDMNYILVLLEEQSAEFKHIKSLFGKSMPSTGINSIRRIQNPRLWQKFCLTKKHMVEDSGDTVLNENLLFHGTSTLSMDGILKEGLDWRMCGANGVAYGQGTYFARTARYSDRYAVNDYSRHQSTPNQFNFAQATNLASMFSAGFAAPNFNQQNNNGNQYLKQPFYFGFGVQGDGGSQYITGGAPQQQGSMLNPYQTPQTVTSSTDKTVVSSVKDVIVPHKKYMFVARVLVGRSCLGQSGIRKPPVDNNDSKRRHFNSCVDNISNPSIFVVFDTAQSYPEYLIEYK